MTSFHSRFASWNGRKPQRVVDPARLRKSNPDVLEDDLRRNQVTGQVERVVVLEDDDSDWN